jgi:hypothetical protein
MKCSVQHLVLFSAEFKNTIKNLIGLMAVCDEHMMIRHTKRIDDWGLSQRIRKASKLVFLM